MSLDYSDLDQSDLNQDSNKPISTSDERRVIPVYPGEKAVLNLRVNGPVGRRVTIRASGLSPSVATLAVSPANGVPPFTSTVEISVDQEAKPGYYNFDIYLVEEAEGGVLEAKPLTLLVLPAHAPKEIKAHYSRMKRLYKTYGAQGVIWYLLARIYKGETRFSKLKEAYELIRGSSVTGATLAVTLNRMIKKGLIARKSRGIYIPLVWDETVAYSRIDTSRIRIPGNKRGRQRKRKTSARQEKALEEPFEAWLAFNRARRIAEKHGRLAAACFLIHSLAGVRQTGFLLLWFDGMFVYCEQKTGMCHYFYSQLLHSYFTRLGLKQGIQYRRDRGHMEAWRISSKYVRKYYGSHQASRRLHYQLKNHGLLEYDEDVYTAEIKYYTDGSLGLRIWDNAKNEVLYEEDWRDQPAERQEIRPVYPFEHIYDPNEETYFHNPRSY